MRFSWISRMQNEHKNEVMDAVRTGDSDAIIKAFLFPRIARKFILRLLIVIAVAYIFFGFICLPMYIKGASMSPTYPDRGIMFCWTPSSWFGSPKRGDVVIMKYGEKGVMILKRVVALEGDTVEFRDGALYVNGKPVSEPYVKGKSDWNLPERTVEKGFIYVVGDNRSMPMEAHVFGQIRLKYLKGVPLW